MKAREAKPIRPFRSIHRFWQPGSAHVCERVCYSCAAARQFLQADAALRRGFIQALCARGATI